ncbi:hypothetical protein ONZ45_g2575 [Pleurotus djamor]|nr:hypothetical protein ONZ45_g18729 [Pleurotus djamor]KAJ8520614.1 hypothetical protein ONZ45_g2575 [Pleurotus djamor]
MLRRAKTAPLRIVCTIHRAEEAPDGFWEVAEKALLHKDRIWELDVVIREMDFCERFLSLAACPAMPMLETLKLSAPHPSLPRMQKALPWAELPSLRVLELRRLAITADFPSLPSLTHLRVIDDAILLSWLIRSLRSMPNVEVIEVQVIFGDTRGSTGPVVALPKLKHLLFKAADFGERDIYEYFDIASAAVVEVRSTSTRL